MRASFAQITARVQILNERNKKETSFMKNPLKMLAITAIALLMAAPAALAQSPEVSTLVLTEQTDVGGTILEPGTYLIRVVSPQADRNKVQITSVDRSKVYATLLTIPHQLEPNEAIPESTFVFYPAGEGRPRALRTWFAADPASGGGHDILYEESRARQLARLANENVVFTREEELAVITPRDTVEPYVMDSEPTIVAETRTTTVTTPVEPAPLVTPEPEPAPMVSSTPADTNLDTTVDTTVDTTEMSTTESAPAMPETSSRMPLLALLGLVSLAAAVVVRFARA
jgi:hypothetical protein